ncbi:hypothetical protein LCGC14_2856420 [marine sediment metagenome]|uniref:Uncharacterized protein n=1 Tax=marine sediment metagenome TaxID=412755 RepID=A0A0F8Y741_9ZZZZ
MSDLTTEPLTLEVEEGIGRLSMRGKTVIVASCHSFELEGQASGRVTVSSRKTESGSVSWPLPLEEAHQVWNELFKEANDARN